ncbi:MAG TPA: DUF2807 domain-containing protein [Ferruginibacter sp.]|nr:DUF2807 domain-containing protein [Ferruginibacter sp.]
MKVKTTLAALLLFATTGVFAQTAERTAVQKKEMPAFTKIDVDAEIDVVLIDDAKAGTVYLVGESKLFNDIKLKVQGNELQISSKRDINYKSKITVEVHVKNLEKVSLKKESLVFSGNTLQSKKINVYIREGSKASLVSSGDIAISSEEDTELVFTRKTAGVTVVNR